MAGPGAGFVRVAAEMVDMADMADMEAAPGPASRLDSLPDDVLLQIFRRCRQRGRVSCMTTCKRFSRLVTWCREAWPYVRFTDLDVTAVEFMVRHRVRHVAIRTECPDDVLWFFDRLADVGCDEDIETLCIDVLAAQRLPEELGRAISRQRGLRALFVTVHELSEASELVFPRAPAGLGLLERLRILENTPIDKQLVVWFERCHASLRSLKEVHLDVSVSDVLAGAHLAPALRSIVYRTDESGAEGSSETFEDATLEGADLDLLELDVCADTDTRTLCEQLERCRVRHLILHVHDGYLALDHRLSPALEVLELRVETPLAELRLDWPFLAECAALKQLVVGIGPEWIAANLEVMQACRHTLLFDHADVADWLRFFRTTELRLLHRVTVTLVPDAV